MTKKQEALLAQALGKPVCIISNGNASTTQIIVNGKPVKGVQRVDISIDLDQVTVTMDIHNVGLVLGLELTMDDLSENEVPKGATIN